MSYDIVNKTSDIKDSRSLSVNSVVVLEKNIHEAKIKDDFNNSFLFNPDFDVLSSEYNPAIQDLITLYLEELNIENGSDFSSPPLEDYNKEFWEDLFLEELESEDIDLDLTKGLDAEIYRITLSSRTITRLPSLELSQNTVSIDATVKIGNSNPERYSGRYKIYHNLGNGFPEIPNYVSFTNETSPIDYVIPLDAIEVKVELYAAGATDVLYDSEIISIIDSGRAYVVIIESSNGSVFKPGENMSTTLTAFVFLNGNDITSSVPSSWFRWRRESFYAQDDDLVWNSIHNTGYKYIEVTANDVNARATFFCDIIIP